MAYARQGPPGGYGQQHRGPAQGAPSGYQYDDPSQPQGYGYSSNGGGGYPDQAYNEPAPVAYHGKAKYFETPPPTRNFDDHGGYGQQGGGYDQRDYDHGGYDQGTQYQGGYDQDGYGQGYQQDDRYAQSAGPAGGGYDQSHGNYQQQPQQQQQQRRPPPQRPGHGGPAPPQPDARHQATGRPMNDRPPPTRQYTDGPRPSTSGGTSIPRGQSSDSGRRPDMPPNGYSSKPRGANAPAERPIQNQPNSPQNMSWDNPFGSFGNVAAPKEKPKSRRDEQQQQRPSTSHSSSSHRHQQNNQRTGESPRSHQRPPQPAHEEKPLPPRQDYGHQGYGSSPNGYNQSSGRGPPPQQQDTYNDQSGYAGHGLPPQQPQPQRNFTPNFSRVQSPPISNGQAPPNMGVERSNTMPADLPVRTVNTSTPTPSFTTDLPFREGRAQTPVYASPQYAEAQSAVIESVSDPPTASTDWNDDGAAHNGYHQPSHSMQGRPGQQANGYDDLYDDYYGSNQGNVQGSPDPGDYDMPNFGNNKGNDELHLDSGTPNTAPMRAPYGQESVPPHSADYQNHGFDFGVNGQPAGSNGYDAYGANDPTQRSFSTAPPQNPQGFPGGRGMAPPNRGMPPPGRGGYPPSRGRGGPPGPPNRSATAPPEQRPNGAGYGPPGPNGRGGPPPARGRGGPGGGGGFAGDVRGPAPPGQGAGPGPGPGGRGGPPGARGRGGPPGPAPGPGRGQPPPDSSNGQPPAPVRPGLMQQGGGAARPPPVRQYTSPPDAGQPPNSYGGPSPAATVADGPVTMGELQKLRMAIADNPGDQETTLTLVKKLVEASTVLAGEDGRADPKTKAKNRERYINDAYKHLKKLCSYNNQEAMFYMAECHGAGQLGLQKDPKEAFLLYQSAAKLGHAPSAYRVAVCCELGESEGGGTKRDPLKAMQWYRRAATLGDLPAMYKLGVILLKGLLGQNPSPGEAVNWLQRAADRADPDNPHALHELGLLYEAPPPQVQNTVFPDPNYSFELFNQAAALGYKFSQYRLGQCFEYGQLGCPIDARQSIAWYSKAAVQEEHQSELALSGWYLTGTEGIIQQSDTEAYLWARKAAQAGLAKAEYAMGYFTETGIGCSANLEDAKRWYWRASAQNFPKARERLEDLRRGGAKATQTRVSRSTMQKNQGDCKPM